MTHSIKGRIYYNCCAANLAQKMKNCAENILSISPRQCEDASEKRHSYNSFDTKTNEMKSIKNLQAMLKKDLLK